jgi:hypothetical protein
MTVTKACPTKTMSHLWTATLFQGTAYIMERIGKGYKVSEVAYPQQPTKIKVT